MVEQPFKPTPLPARRGLLAELLVPPDFDPERQVDAMTWAEAVFEPVALIGTVVCFVLGLIQLGQALSPAWPTRFLPPLSVLVGAEAFFYSRRLNRPAAYFKEWLVLLAPVIALARFLPYLEDPASSLGHDLALWWREPGSFFTLGFVADTIILLLVWGTVYSSTQNLNQLRVQPGEIVDPTEARLRHVYEDNWRAIDHSAPLRALGERYAWGGVILVLLASLAALGVNQVFSLEAIGQIVGFQRPSVSLVRANVVLYFVLGLLLLGEAHFVRQRTLWRLDRVELPPELPTRWIGATVGLVLLALVVAFLLPTSYAMTLGDLVSYVGMLIAEIFLLIGGAIFYVFYALLSLLGLRAGGGAGAPPAQPLRLPTAPPAPTGSSPLETVRSLIFWLIALGILAYSLGVLWRKRGPWLGHLSLLAALRTPWSWLRALLRLGRKVGGDVGRVLAALPRRLRPAPLPPPRPPGFIRLSRLSPRDLVVYFYLSTTERAARLGQPRPPGATPDEYRRQLRQSLPQVDPEIDALTDAFLAARYGPRPTTVEAARSVRKEWEVLKRKLRAARLGSRGSAHRS